ncbi:MAG: AAA family ATPase [Rhodocyclales bacterium]|nr:AAA family ATPase [Rhodocyclales bacterium]
MAKHPDAVGYLNDLAREVNEPWFQMICDLAAVSSVPVIDQPTIDTLSALYTDRASYIGVVPAATAATTAAAAAAPADSLDQLSCFTNFKLLGDALEVSFRKRITLIFGANGSGKSSLCESLKVLATTEPSIRPLQNVRAAGTGAPAFRYKFKSDAALQVWTPAIGYGPRRAIVKYFDTAIAIRNVKNPVEPGRVIVLTPFRLHIFEWAKALTTKLRETLQREQQRNSVKLIQTLEAIRADFAKFKGRPLAVIDEKTVDVLPAEMMLGEGFADQKLLSEKQAAAAELEKAASEEGLKLLRASHHELEDFLTSVNTLLTSASSLWALEPTTKAKVLADKQAEQEVLAQALVPKNGTLDRLLALLNAASPLCKLDEATGLACPLCNRVLGAPEVELFRRYHDLLVGELEKDIAALKSDIAKALEFAKAVINVNRKGWEKYTTIHAEVLTAAKADSAHIVAGCDVSKEPMTEARGALESLKASAAVLAAQLESKENAIEAAEKGRDEVIKRLVKLRAEIEPMEYAQAVAERLHSLKGAHWRANRSKYWDTKLPAFTQTLTKITKKAKDAYEELVVIDFEVRLNDEYKALAEKDMAAFGVMLARKGTDAAVTVLPQIGGKDIEGVLSEGEQRVHALALFFAELETCSQSVLVFDDPISSFDYNYIANYCARLRDFLQKHPTRQIIVLTHNWEFFVQLQTTLNQAGLDSHLSVQVLENCAAVSDYSEKIDDLKKDIEGVLNAPGEPSKAQKEDIAGKMRRLIEVVVNTHVFNQQRHQYKQKSQAISAFQSFTKIVPLLQTEATLLRDLFAKLSITEHDDPRNAYVNTDKAMFQTRYDQICNVETAVAARKP